MPISHLICISTTALFLCQIRENKTAVFDTTSAWRTDSYFSVGILGFALYVLLGITSLPSVSNALSWREFSFVQVKLFLCVYGYWCACAFVCVCACFCVVVFFLRWTSFSSTFSRTTSPLFSCVFLCRPVYHPGENYWRENVVWNRLTFNRKLAS